MNVVTENRIIPDHPETGCYFNEFDVNLVNFFVAIIEYEKRFETMKNYLAETEDYKIGDVLNRIDLNGKGNISAHDIKNFLKDNSVYVKDVYIQNFVNFYQGSYRSNNFVSPYISYHNFTNFLLSKTESDLNFEVLSRNYIENYKGTSDPNEICLDENYYQGKNSVPNKISNKKSYLSYDVESTISKLLEEEINLIQILSNLLDNFFCDENFKIFSIIKRLDKNGNRSINEIDLEKYLGLSDRGYEINRRDCKLILYRLDRDSDSSINYEELKFVFKTHITELNSYSIPKQINLISFKHESNNSEKIEIINRKNFHNFSNNLLCSNVGKKGIKKSQYLNKENMDNPFLFKNKFSENQKDFNINKLKNNYNFFSLSNYIQEMIPLESNLEEIKKDLANCNDVILQELFGLFNSIKNQNKVDKLSFQKILNKFLVYPTDEEIDLIFSRYDKDGDLFLDFYEFSEIFLPFSPEHIKIMKNRLPMKPNNKISYDSKSYLIKLLKTLINNEAHLELNRRKLCSLEFFSAYEEFAKLKTFNQNFADLETFFYFINDQKILIRFKNEINLIFNKFDRDSDGKISFNEFIKEITPQELA